jgi:protein tyrosine/serine phosphatase
VVAWRRLFRSAELAKMTRSDFDRLTGEFGLASVIDLRSAVERERQGIGLLSETGVKFHHVSFLTDGGNTKADERRYTDFPGMGEFYVYLVRRKEFCRKIIEALEIIAEPGNHPLVFHCAIGKDRTGLLAAILLSALGVGDEDIIADYALSDSHMVEILKRMNSKPETAEFVKRIPAYFWRALPESMALLLTTLREDYGSAGGYLKSMGAEPALIERLETALLV